MTPRSPRSPTSAATGFAGAATGVLLANAAVALIGVVALAILSAFFDARIATVMTDVPPVATTVAGLFSDLGRSGYMFALASLVVAGSALAPRSARFRAQGAALAALRDRALYVLGVLATSGVLAQAIKHLIGRARPTLMPTFGPYYFDLLSMKASLASFPSGHATTVFGTAAALSLLVPRVRVPLFLFAALVAASRVVVEAHYVSDVVAGGVLGIACALVVAWAFAAWSVAFERDAGAIRLKDPGVVLRGLRGGRA